MRIVETIDGIEGVAAGGTAVLNLPVNRRYHWLKFFVAGTANSVSLAAHLLIESVQLYVSGKLQRDVTSDFLRWLPKFNGLGLPASNCVPVYFSEPWRASVMDEQASAWDVFGESSFTLKIKFKADDGAAHAITGLTFTGLSCYDGGQATLNGKVIRTIIKQLPQTDNASGGSFDVTKIPISDPLQRLYFYNVAATKVEIKADGFKVFEASADENKAILSDYGFVTTAADSGGPLQPTYTVAFDPAQQLFDALNVQRNLVGRVYSSAGGQLPMIIESRAGTY